MRADPGGPKTVRKARRINPKATVVAPPKGDVASSGGNYGLPEAKRAERSKPVKRAQRAAYDAAPVKQRQQIVKNATGSVAANIVPIHDARVARNRELAASAATKDTKGNADRQRATAFLAAHPEILKPTKPQKHGSLLGTITGAANLGIKIGSKVAATATPLGTLHVDPVKALKNEPKDAADLVTSAPTSAYLLAQTALHHPTKVPGMLAAPYIELAKHPSDFITKHPVSTALMLQPVVRTPGSLAGKGLRLAGKQSLRGTIKTLPGTALKQETRLSKDALVNAVQVRRAKGRPAVVTPAEVRARVDAHVEFRRKHVRRVEAAATAEAKKRGYTPAQTESHVSGAKGGASIQNDRTFVKEFGATWQRGPSGALIKPKHPTEGRIHATRPDAEHIVTRLAKAGLGEFVVKKISDREYGVVPKVAAEQLRRHQVVGTSNATYAKVLRVSRQKFTNAVLPLSPKWLTGQVVEGTGRALIHNQGPVGVATGLMREKRVFNALERQQPGAGKDFRNRALPLGHYGGQVQEFRSTPMHEIFNESDGKIGEWLAKASRAGEKAPGAKRVVHGWNRYTRTVFDQVNARGIEGGQQRAILGRALKDSPLMERSILGLSKKAADEAARGLRGTHTQVQFGRAVERAYGKYSNFTPAQRERNLHWTPFLPWYANAVKFLTVVLPKDHPVLSSLMASGNVATQKERVKRGLSPLAANHKPLFMLGGIPVKGGNVIRVGHYTPFAIGENNPASSIADLVLPQFAGGYKNLIGIDWKGDPLKHGVGFKAKPFSDPEALARALATEVEALTPGAGQAARISGIEDRLSGKKPAGSIGERAIKEIHPFRPTGTAKPKPKKTRKARRKSQDILSSGGGSQQDILK